ncbi:hypothetical protein HYS47_03875 [Candidatus Woesearchaeota archaeon]|nr:hypothetical protein [Candidatus Woesearchaeota archaeon]
MISCQRCGMEIRTYNKLRKWCVDCRQNLTNERARLRNQQKKLLRKSGQKRSLE